MERAERAQPIGFPRPAVAFRDGLGERRQILDPTGTETVELLCVRPELAAVPSFEFALRERVSRLAAFRHPCYARVRTVERLTDGGATLTVVSDAVQGVRLSDMLQHAEERRLNLDITTALCLIAQLVPAVEALHLSARDVSHGALSPERLVITPHAQLVITEYVMGAALEQLRYQPPQYWTELRLPVAASVTPPYFDQRTDVMQIGLIALALILGRAVRNDEYPQRVPEVVASTWALSARGGFEPLPPGLRAWLGRALQLDSRQAFATAIEARAELDKVLGDSQYVSSPASLEAFLARHYAVEKIAAAASLTPPAGLVRPVSITAPSGDAPPRPSLAPLPSPSSRTTAGVPPPVVAKATIAVASPTVPSTNDAAPVTAQQHPPVAASPGRGLPVEEDHHDEAEERAGTGASGRGKRIAAAAAVVILLGAAGVYAGRGYFGAAPAVATTGTLVITTNPPGAAALVDGTPRGVTPLTLSLTPGAHTVELRGGGEPRTVPVTITAGQEVNQYLELPAAAATSGQLQVRTEPAGARVTVDGVPRGISPTVVASLTPGEHIVTLESDLGSVKQMVTIESGITASLVVPMGAPQGAPVSGWVSVTTPIDVQLFEGGRLIGTSQSERIMVGAGRHELELVNEGLGFRAVRTVQVNAGRVAPIQVEVPKGTLALNALPWADVWIDGERAGETPLGNVSLPIGRHNIVFRHPELGEQVHTVTVTLKEVTRLSVDLRKR